MERDPRHSSIPRKRAPSSMRAAIASGYIRVGGAVGGSIGRPSGREGTPYDNEPFDIYRHKANKPARREQESDPPTYIGEPEIMKDFDGREHLGVIIPTSGVTFYKEGFILQEQDPQDPRTYTAGILIKHQEGYFSVGGSARKSNELRLAVGDAGGSRQVEYVLIPGPYNPREINSVVANNGLVVVSLGHKEN